MCVNERGVDGPLLQYAARRGTVVVGADARQEIRMPPRGGKMYSNVQRRAGDDAFTGELVDNDFPEADDSQLP